MRLNWKRSIAIMVVAIFALMMVGPMDSVMASKIGVRYKTIDELNSISAPPADADSVVVYDVSDVEEKKFPVSLFISGHASGSTTMVSTATHIEAAGLAFGLIRKTMDDPSDQKNTIADGTRGKMVTLTLIAKAAGNWLITSTGVADADAITGTGWSTITLDTVLDSVTLLWLDDTTGWIIIGNNGVTVS